jgi:hypothetical protein
LTISLLLIRYSQSIGLSARQIFSYTIDYPLETQIAHFPIELQFSVKTIPGGQTKRAQWFDCTCANFPIDVKVFRSARHTRMSSTPPRGIADGRSKFFVESAPSRCNKSSGFPANGGWCRIPRHCYLFGTVLRRGQSSGR